MRSKRGRNYLHKFEDNLFVARSIQVIAIHVGTLQHTASLQQLPYSILNITQDRPWPLSTSRALFWYPESPRPMPGTDHQDLGERNYPGPSPARSDFMSTRQWLMARAWTDDPDGLMLAAKGGHNNEPHNHNDVGNFILHWRGESLVAELGAGEYTKDYFREGRYAIITNRSRGHNVPLVNGCEQCPGESCRAVDVQHRSGKDEETLEMEIGAAYPAEAGLASLRRRFIFWRTLAPGRLTVIDAVRFREDAGEEGGRFESALITFAEVQIGKGWMTLTGETGALQIEYDARLLDVVTEPLAYNDFSLRRREATRIAFVLRQPAREAMVILDFQPDQP